MTEDQDRRRWARLRRPARTIIAMAAVSIGIAVLAPGTTAAAAATVGSAVERGPLNAALAIPAVPAVAAGYAHTCTIRTDGTLWCWGSNYSGELGDGTATSQTTPERAGTATNWAGIDAGGNFTCALRTDGTLWCWGSNTRGQLGDGSTTNRNTPVQVGTATNWASVSAGDSHTCAVRTDGTHRRRNDECSRTHERCGPILVGAQIREQQAVVVDVVARARVASRVDARRTLEGVDADARVIGDRRKPGEFGCRPRDHRDFG